MSKSMVAQGRDHATRRPPLPAPARPGRKKTGQPPPKKAIIEPAGQKTGRGRPTSDLRIGVSDMNVFIDTNVFLLFYHLTSEDLEELKKLLTLVASQKIVLYLTSQVQDEYRRNRENKIQEAIDLLKRAKLEMQLPALCRAYPEYHELQKLRPQLERLSAEITQKVSEDANNGTLKADDVIRQIMSKGKILASSADTLRRAQTRVMLGNPPGKDGSLGDAINWELLLTNIPETEGLHIVSGDRDFASALDKNRLKEFLVHEWKEAKRSDIHFYTKISDFFARHFQQIRLAVELEQEAAVDDLVGSSTFRCTHAAIAKLRVLGDLRSDQVDAIAEAALLNSQIRLILTDEDVAGFIMDLLAKHATTMDQVKRNNLLTEISARIARDAASESIAI